MRNLLICVVLLLAAAGGPFFWAWWFASDTTADQVVAGGASTDVASPDGASANDRPNTPPPTAPTPDDLEPPPRNPLIGALQQLVEESPAFEEQGDSLQRQLADADDLLTRIKAENRAALERLRQNPLRRRNRSSQPRGKPHLIVIDLGQLSTAMLSCYSSEAEPTPLLDKLAGQGVRFDRFFRSSIEPQQNQRDFVAVHHQVASRGDDADRDVRANTQANTQAAATLTERLIAAGYETAIIGDATFLGGNPNNRGFDSWFGFADPAERSFWPERVAADGASLNLVLDDGEQFDSQTILMTEAFSFAKRQRTGQPFFLWLSLPYPDARIPKSPGSVEPLPVETQLRRIEQQLIQWIGLLNESRIANNSIVVLTSLSAPAETEDASSLAHSRLRAPLIILGPGRVAAGKIHSGLCTPADLAATLLQLAGAGAPAADHDAYAFADAVRRGIPGRGTQVSQGRPYVAWRRDAKEVVVFEHWRYERVAGKTAALYDLREGDPVVDVSGANPPVIVQGKKWLANAEQR